MTADSRLEILPQFQIQAINRGAETALIFHFQNDRKPARCHAMTVSGLTMTSAERTRARRWTATPKGADQTTSIGRFTERWRTLSW